MTLLLFDKALPRFFAAESTQAFFEMSGTYLDECQTQQGSPAERTAADEEQPVDTQMFADGSGGETPDYRFACRAWNMSPMTTQKPSSAIPLICCENTIKATNEPVTFHCARTASGNRLRVRPRMFDSPVP